MIDSAQQSGVFKIKEIGEANAVTERNCRSLRQCNAFIRTGSSEYDMDYFMREQPARATGTVVYHPIRTQPLTASQTPSGEKWTWKSGSRW